MTCDRTGRCGRCENCPLENHCLTDQPESRLAVLPTTLHRVFARGSALGYAVPLYLGGLYTGSDSAHDPADPGLTSAVPRSESYSD